VIGLSTVELARRLVLAVVIGGLLGAERELRHKSAGFRTNILIGLGSAIFTVVSVSMAGDPGRIAAQIVTGIGFFGAGAILRGREGVHGLTTAATVWVNAALGMAAGAGEYRLAILGGFIALAVLLILGPIEGWVERRTGGRRH
jgi:putative Mg2+ transporter-C (MgtC) family protein